MGLCNSPNIFQEKIDKRFNGLEYVKAYIDDLLIVSNSNFEEHLIKKMVLKKLRQLVSKSMHKTICSNYK